MVLALESLSTPLFSPDDSGNILQFLQDEGLSWLDGRLTAGTQAAEVKRNRQLDPTLDESIRIIQLVRNQICQNPLIKSWALIRSVHSLIISRSDVGDGYGWHVDNPFSKAGRRDLSFTLFLSDLDTYAGGSLEIQSSQNASSFRLPQGHVLVYPSSALHRVAPVTSGSRFVCVGWIESYVQSEEDRLLLFNLDAAARGLLSKHGSSSEVDLLFQVYSNALRRLSA